MIDRIEKREIYKSVGEIELTSDLYKENIFNKYTYDKDKIILDIVKISYYGKEMCDFYTNSKYRKNGVSKMYEDVFIISVYYKNKEYEKEANDYFDKLLPLKI